VVFASFMVYLAFKCCTISLTKVRKDLEASAKFVATHHLSFKSKVRLREEGLKLPKCFCLSWAVKVSHSYIFISTSFTSEFDISFIL